jgi:hypothetical protein
MVAHSRTILSEYRPLRDGEELLKAVAPHADFCIAASRRLLESEGRYAEWIADVAAAVAAVDTQAVAVEQMMRSKGTGELKELEVRSALKRLSKVAERLEAVFSGRGYFNYSGTN